MSDILFSELYSILSPPVFGAVGWMFARRRYKAEISTTEIENEKSAIQIWRELGQYHKSENESLKSSIDELKANQRKCHEESEALRTLVLRYSLQLAEVRTQMSLTGYKFDPNLIPPEDDLNKA